MERHTVFVGTHKESPSRFARSPASSLALALVGPLLKQSEFNYLVCSTPYKRPGAVGRSYPGKNAPNASSLPACLPAQSPAAPISGGGKAWIGVVHKEWKCTRCHASQPGAICEQHVAYGD